MFLYLLSNPGGGEHWPRKGYGDVPRSSPLFFRPCGAPFFRFIWNSFSMGGELCHLNEIAGRLCCISYRDCLQSSIDMEQRNRTSCYPVTQTIQNNTVLEPRILFLYIKLSSGVAYFWLYWTKFWVISSLRHTHNLYWKVCVESFPMDLHSTGLWFDPGVCWSSIGQNHFLASCM